LVPDEFGASLAFDSTGTNLYIGAPESFLTSDCAATGHPPPGGGVLYHFSKATGVWAEVQFLKGSNTECLNDSTGDFFGWEMAHDALTDT
jgi:hypothetical protein